MMTKHVLCMIPVHDYGNYFFEVRTGDAIRLSSMKSKYCYKLLCEFKESNPIVLGYWEEKCNIRF